MLLSALRKSTTFKKRPVIPVTRRRFTLKASHSEPPGKWWGFGSNDHGQFGHGDLFAVYASPTELESVQSLGLSQLSVGMNTCLGSSNSSLDVYFWGENHGQSILPSIEGDISIPSLLARSSVAYAGWDSIWIGNDEDNVMMRYGPHKGPTILKTVKPSEIQEIASSAFQTVFLTRDGSVVFYNDRNGVSFKPVPLPSTFKQVARGWSHFLLLDNSGAVWSVGANKHGQCGVGHFEHILSPCQTESLKGVKVKSIASGASHSLALTESGSVLCWGSFKDGKLGFETDKDQLEPTELLFFSDKDIVSLAAGCDHSVAVSRQGDVYAWGFGQHGALGLNNLDDSPTPKLVSRPKGPILDVQCGMDVTFMKIAM